MKLRYPILRSAAVSLFFAAALVLSGEPAARAGSTTINTAPLAGHTGSLDFQFNPGTAGTPLDASAAITLTDLGGGTLLATLPTITGAGTGDLNPNATLSNTDAANGVLKGITFGTSLTFNTTFTFTPNAAADDSSDFFLILRDATLNAIPTTDPSGNDFAALTSLDAHGNVPALTVYQVNAASVPEPSSFLSLSLLLVLTGGLVLRRVRPCRPA